ncbi:hypothetical protein GOODEAATRI_024635 [Goodea atripinnis]|uniref:Uncharacterized protein n=1 Tax=Goodea atripinnis TaxID=208336 RepID=A0ABV0NN04_9TELE
MVQSPEQNTSFLKSNKTFRNLTRSTGQNQRELLLRKLWSQFVEKLLKVQFESFEGTAEAQQRGMWAESENAWMMQKNDNMRLFLINENYFTKTWFLVLMFYFLWHIL